LMLNPQISTNHFKMNNKILRLKFDFNPNNADSVQVMLPHDHRILSFGPDSGKAYSEFITDRPFIDVMLDTDTPHEQWTQRRFIMLPIGAEGINRNLMNYRQLLGSFVAPNGKQCYVFEGGMVGV
jgi:hypothetical protein